MSSEQQEAGEFMQSWEEVVLDTSDQLEVFLKNLGRGNAKKKPAELAGDADQAWELATALQAILAKEEFIE